MYGIPIWQASTLAYNAYTLYMYDCMWTQYPNKCIYPHISGLGSHTGQVSWQQLPRDRMNFPSTCGRSHPPYMYMYIFLGKYQPLTVTQDKVAGPYSNLLAHMHTNIIHMTYSVDIKSWYQIMCIMFTWESKSLGTRLQLAICHVHAYTHIEYAANLRHRQCLIVNKCHLYSLCKVLCYWKQVTVAFRNPNNRTM